MTMESECPFRDKTHVCIMGNRYKLLDREHPDDALLYAGCDRDGTHGS